MKTCRPHRLGGLSLLGLALLTSSLMAAQMPNPADYAGERVVEADVPNEAVLQLLLDAGLQGLACTPTPGDGPWIIDADGEALLKSLGVDHHDLVPDLEAFMTRRNAERRATRAARGGEFYSDYRTLPEIVAHMADLATQYPDLYTAINIGTSHEGRSITGFVIRSGPENGRPAVLFNGCQHAREWISPMTTLYIGEMLLAAAGSDPVVTSMLERLEVVIIPVSNPDGYEFTYAAGGDRYWRKNRRDNPGSCEGVDLNRNWGSDWNGGQSTSNDPCSDIYVGPSSMSEPEVSALAGYMQAHGNIRGQIDFHSYSQLILEPRGYTTIPPPDWDDLHALGGDMHDAILGTHGKSYTHDNPCNILYCASGTLIDWPYDTYGAMAYCVELRPGSSDPGGFDPPASEILPCGQENYNGILKMMEWVLAAVDITLPNGPPTMVSPDVETTFEVNIVARGENPVASEAKILWRSDGGSFTESTLTHLGGEDFVATLPPFACDSNPEFYLVAAGHLGGESRLPSAAPAEVFAATSVSDLEVVFEDNAETNPGWSVSGDASDGHWDRGVPVGGGDRGDAPADADGSGSCWQTDNVDGNSDVDGGVTILTSPAMDTSAGGYRLAYWRWFSNSTGASPGEDRMVVEVSDDNGASWIVLEVVGPTGAEASGGWYRPEFNLDSVPGLNPTEMFRLRVTAEDIFSGSVVEAALDGILLSKSDCIDDDDCPADVVGNDGFVGVDDMLAVLGAYGSTDAEFDIDGDGWVGVNDILLIISAWGEC